jgi:very-short-patch-repair endonuclease
VTASDERGFRSTYATTAAECDETHATGRFRRTTPINAIECDETHVGDGAITTLAARQCGVVTTSQLAAAGIGERAVAHRVQRGWLTRLHRGVYRVGPIAAPWQREMAAVLATNGILSHHSAAAVWGITPPHPGDVHVIARGRSRPGVRVHRAASLRATAHHGLPLTTPARTLDDLEPMLSARDYDRALEEAQVRGLVPKRPGDEPRFTRSAAERRLLALVRAAKLPVPLTNTRLHGWEVDALWPQHKLVLEVDGYRYHGNRAAFERDRRKDAALTAAGYRVVRITWRRLVDEPHVIVALLARLLPP